MPPKKEKPTTVVKSPSASVSGTSASTPYDGDGAILTENGVNYGELILKAINNMSTGIEKLCMTFNTNLDKTIQAIDAKLTTKIEAQSVEIFELNKRLEKLEKSNQDLKKENSELKTANDVLSKKLTEVQNNCDNLDQMSRKNNLLIHGLPEQENCSLEDGAIRFLNSHFDIKATVTDFQSITKMSTNNDNKPPAVMLEFKDMKKRKLVLEKRKLLKNKGISITQHLAPSRAKMLKKANELVKNKKVQQAWSAEGKIFIKQNENGRILQIKALSDLNRY